MAAASKAPKQPIQAMKAIKAMKAMKATKAVKATQKPMKAMKATKAMKASRARNIIKELESQGLDPGILRPYRARLLREVCNSIKYLRDYMHPDRIGQSKA